VLLGQLGHQLCFRCRGCGWDWQLPAPREGNPPPGFWEREAARLPKPTYPLPPPGSPEWFWEREMAMPSARARGKKAGKKKAGKRKKNPLLATINPGHGGKRGKPGKNPVVGWVDAKQAAGHPLLAKAQKEHQAFHGRRAKKLLVVRVDDGKPGVTQKLVVGLGMVPETVYSVPQEWGSSKGPHTYVHDHPAGKEPIEVKDPETGLTMKLPTYGGMRVTNWWHG
jgi:hypothetical protein